jgi:uncharacterized protein YyaL (SSP411 family)
MFSILRNNIVSFQVFVISLMVTLVIPRMVFPSGDDHRYTNRLIKEKSPYLLQHAHNPVDWFPWGEEVFERARKEKKLIFLSIGYSTCHWCHVMERESFEDEGVAAVLNKYFVAIKVDREERPDIDQVYMDVCMRLTGSGGWPLNIIMTPDKFPLFAGTYIPKESRYGRTGIIELLERAANAWSEDPERILSAGRNIVADIQKQAETLKRSTDIDRSIFNGAEKILQDSFDTRNGGFGTAPKFPRPHMITFLLRRYRRTGNLEYLQMAEKTLQAMRRGGVFDHVGFGFHRYSTDAEWFLPHFEKMLYDQAGLALAYLEAFQVTGKPDYAQTFREIFTYVLRDMTGKEGGFYSAVDADSEGIEGKFYLWTRDQILDVLGRQEGELFSRVFGVTGEGNYLEEATREKTGGNIIYLPRPVREWAERLKMEPDQLAERLDKSRRFLLKKRGKRIHPHVDDKVITAWNGLMISAFARGARIVGETRYAIVAERAADFILTTMRREDGRLMRRYREGEVAVAGFAEDYAFLARGILDIYQLTLDPERLRQALGLSDSLATLFIDESSGYLFGTASDAEVLVIRPRKVYDGAIPSANSVALEVFARLFLLTGDVKWSLRANNLLGGFAAQIAGYPAGYTQLLQGAALLLEPTREVVISGMAGSPDTKKMFEVIWRSYAPETIMIFRPTENPEKITKLAKFTAEMESVGGRAAAYVCQNFTCESPLTEPAKLKSILESAPTIKEPGKPSWYVED